MRQVVVKNGKILAHHAADVDITDAYPGDVEVYFIPNTEFPQPGGDFNPPPEVVEFSKVENAVRAKKREADKKVVTETIAELKTNGDLPADYKHKIPTSTGWKEDDSYEPQH